MPKHSKFSTYRNTALAKAAYGVGKHLYSKYAASKPNGVTKRRPYTKAKSKSGGRTGGRLGAARHQGPLTFTRGRRMMPSTAFIKKVREACAQPNVLLDTIPYQTIGGIGLAAWTVPPPLYNIGDLLNQATHYSGANATTKYLIRDASLTINLTNASSGVCLLRCYFYVPRRDVPLSSTVTSIGTLVSQGFTDSGSAAALTNITSTLFGSASFVTWCKITKVRLIRLAPGETKTVNIIQRSPKLINTETLQPGGTNWLMIPRQAMGIAFQQFGQTVNDSTTTTAVSTDGTKVNFVCNYRYRFQVGSDISTTIFSGSSLGTVTTAQYINEDTGAKITDIQS